MKFALKGNETIQKCISKSKSGWIKDSCKSQVVEDQFTNKKSVTCSCLDLSPTTVIQDFQSLITDSYAAKAFSAEGAAALLSVGVWNLYMFYVLSLKTVLLIALLIKGYAWDLADPARPQ